MANDGSLPAPFVSDFLEVANLAVASFDMVVGPDFLTFLGRLIEVDQKFLHLLFAQHLKRFFKSWVVQIFSSASHPPPYFPSLFFASSK